MYQSIYISISLYIYRVNPRGTWNVCSERGSTMELGLTRKPVQGVALSISISIFISTYVHICIDIYIYIYIYIDIYICVCVCVGLLGERERDGASQFKV